MEKIWLRQYPTGVPADIKTDLYPSLVGLFEDSLRKYRELPAYRFMGRALGFGEIDDLSRAFGAYLQSQGLSRGDRVAIMMPNVPQYPVAVVAILRAGFVVVNVNPLSTPRELEHVLKDSGARAVIVLENFAATLQQVGSTLPARKVIVAAMSDLLGRFKGALVNRAVRGGVPPWELPGAVPFKDALAAGRRKSLTEPRLGPDDIAVLQYTGGTTGISRAAVLLHRNLVANLLQAEAWYRPALGSIPPGEQVVTVCVLPLHHIFGFNINMMLGMRMGGCNLLIADPHDTPAVLKELARHRFHSVPAVDTLFSAWARHADCDKVDWRSLKISIGGGMPVKPHTARLWLEKTGCPICEGYGLSETSPSVTCNPVDSTTFSGNVGLPLPGTDIRLLDDDGREVPPGMPGEIAIKGPQVMAGYWQRPDETARVMTADGYLRSGDIGTVDSRGFFKIVDRKKDMILVSGFNVYASELEEVIGSMPGVLECAAVGVPDAQTGEAVKVVIVKADPALSEAAVHAFCTANLTGYKRPKGVEFRNDLPKNAVGRILRRELRRQPS